FFFQAEDGIRDYKVTGVQTCAIPIFARRARQPGRPAPARTRAAGTRAASFRQGVRPVPVGGWRLRVERRCPLSHDVGTQAVPERSEERRVGKECRSWWGTGT